MNASQQQQRQLQIHNQMTDDQSCCGGDESGISKPPSRKRKRTTQDDQDKNKRKTKRKACGGHAGVPTTGTPQKSGGIMTLQTMAKRNKTVAKTQSASAYGKKSKRGSKKISTKGVQMTNDTKTGNTYKDGGGNGGNAGDYVLRAATPNSVVKDNDSKRSSPHQKFSTKRKRDTSEGGNSNGGRGGRGIDSGSIYKRRKIKDASH